MVHTVLLASSRWLSAWWLCTPHNGCCTSSAQDPLSVLGAYDACYVCRLEPCRRVVRLQYPGILLRQCADSRRCKLAGDNMSDDPNLRDEDELAGEEAALETAVGSAEAQGALRTQRTCRSCPLCIQPCLKSAGAVVLRPGP